MAAAAFMAVITALAAAWWPARSLSKMSVMAALSGRPPRPRPARRFAALGCGLLVAGVIGLVLANPAVAPGDASHHGRLLLVVGLLTSTVGLLFLAPVAIGALAARAGRARVAGRLAVRDLSRHQARSGAALAAVTLAVFIAVTISVTAEYQVAGNGPTVPNLPANELVVFRSNPREPLPDISADELRTAQHTVATIASGVGVRKVLELETARDPNSELLQDARIPGRERAALLSESPVGRGGKRIELLMPLYVATPAVLAHDGIDPAKIDPTADVVIAKPALAKVRDAAARRRLVLGANPRHTIDPKIQSVDVANVSTSGPVGLITAHGVAALGLEPIVAGWLLQAPRPITAAQIGSAARSADSAGLVVETPDSHTASPLGKDASIAGILLALGVLAMTVGLIRAESASDLRILAATGAAGRTRRALTGATAGSLATLGVLLGAGGAYAVAMAWYHRRLWPLGHPPFANLLIIALGLPVAATVGAWVLGGRQPPAIARRPIE
jgi:putative ABC transport system permease protein